MTSMTVELQLGCELTVPAVAAARGARPAAWLAEPAMPGRQAHLFAQARVQQGRVGRLDLQRTCLLCHETVQHSVGLSVRPFGA